MPRTPEATTRLSEEMFRFIELRVAVTSKEVAEKLWIGGASARVMLSRYTNYKMPDGKIKHFLIYNPPPSGSVRGGKNRVPGTYSIGPDQWWSFIRRKQE